MLPAETLKPRPVRSSARCGKVLHVGKFYPPHMGGIETHLEALCSELTKSFDVRVVVSNDAPSSSEETRDEIQISRVSTRFTFASTPFSPGMVSEIRKSDADIIHIHLPNPMAVIAYLASRHRGRLVVTYHSDTVRQKFLGAMFGPLLHRMLRQSSAIIATSPDYRRTSAVLAHYQDRCHVIPYGIALDEFEQCDSNEVAQLRRKFGNRVVVSVGRLVYYKGFEYLIQAMTRVDGRLVLIGDGPLRAKLQQLVSGLGLQDRVIFAGEIQNQDVIPYYHAADVFALASIARSEAFGIVQIEAMAAGLPVVNTKLDSGVPFVSIHNQTGLTVPPNDPQAMAAGITKLLDDPSLRAQYGEAARMRARQEFSVEAMTSRFTSLYQAVLDQPAPR